MAVQCVAGVLADGGNELHVRALRLLGGFGGIRSIVQKFLTTTMATYFQQLDTPALTAAVYVQNTAAPKDVSARYTAGKCARNGSGQTV